MNDYTITVPNPVTEIYRHQWTDDEIGLRQRVHSPNMYEMIRNGEWIGAADYHDNLVRKLTRNGYEKQEVTA